MTIIPFRFTNKVIIVHHSIKETLEKYANCESFQHGMFGLIFLIDKHYKHSWIGNLQTICSTQSILTSNSVKPMNG